MTDKLTLSDCFKYPNAKVIPADIGKWSGWIKSIDIEHKMLVVSLKGFYPEVHMDVHIADCKLILRDISELTDEEKEYAEYNYFFEECGDWANICEVFKCALGTFDGNNSVELADYLRSINVDIDGFFKCGKAVKE